VSTQILVLRPTDTAPLSVSADELPVLLASPENVVWVDILQPEEGARQLLADVFRLHPATIEDVLAATATPKLEWFDDYLYAVWQALSPGWEKQADFELHDLDVVIGRNFLVTVHNRDLPSVTHATGLVASKPDCMRKGPAYLAYVIADVLMARFLPLMDRLEREIDDLETKIMREPGPHVLEILMGLKDKLQRLRRVGVHQREVLARMSRDHGPHEVEIIGADVRPFFRDAYDDFVRVVDLVNSFRETLDSAMGAYLGMQGHKLNEIMKMLTLISTIMLPLTFIAGVYGMNFQPDASPFNMPELRFRFGYITVLVVMAVTAGGFLIYFRRQRWL
jgi:magnesium transporter